MGLMACPLCRPGQKCQVPGDCAGGDCQGTCQCPSGMVVVPRHGGGVDCIDSIEVTGSAYALFYQANPSIATQGADCAWNQNWTPSNGSWLNNLNLDYPITYVNLVPGRCLLLVHGPAPVRPNRWRSRPAAELCRLYPGPVVQRLLLAGRRLPREPVDQRLLPLRHDLLGGRLPGRRQSQLRARPAGFDRLPRLSGRRGRGLPDERERRRMGGLVQPVVRQDRSVLRRGGSYLDTSSALRCDSGGTAPVTQMRMYSGPDVGFRCCV